MSRPRKHSDEHLLQVARAVFLEQGAAVPLSTIAARVGLSQPALSTRFGSKEALLLRALLPPARIPWAERLSDGPDPRPLVTQLHEIARDALLFFAETLPAMVVLRTAGIGLLSTLTAHTDPPHERVRLLVVGFFARARQQGRLRDVEPQAAAMMFIGALQTPAMLAYVHSTPLSADHAEVLAAQIVDLLWSGIAPREDDR